MSSRDVSSPLIVWLANRKIMGRKLGSFMTPPFQIDRSHAPGDGWRDLAVAGDAEHRLAVAWVHGSWPQADVYARFLRLGDLATDPETGGSEID